MMLKDVLIGFKLQMTAYNCFYTQVVDNRRIIKGFFWSWSIMDHYSQDCSLDDDNIQSDSWRHF